MRRRLRRHRHWRRSGGVAAAVSSARNGAKTLLVEKRNGLGGLLTFGMLNFLDIKHGSDGKSINKGLFTEWHKLVGGDSAFDIELGKAAFYKMVADEKNLTLSLSTQLVSAQLGADGSTVEGVKLRNKNGEFSVSGKRFIDATIDADFAAMSGAPFFIGGEDIFDKSRLMSVTPVIHLKGIDWAKLKKASKASGWKFGKVDFNDTTAWGFAELFTLYKPVENNTRLRGLNLVRIRQSDGDHFYINALQIFGVNGLNENEKKTALEVGRRETDHIVEYLRKEMAGFEKATVASDATELYVRETRHLKALYQLPMSDVWRNQDHWDSIGHGGYPVDIQGTSLKDLGTVVSNPKTYAIPLRSLIPQKLTNMLVVGRAAGYSSIAAGSARVVPTGMTTGEAAGAAAAQSIKSNVNFHKFSADEKLVETLRTTLEKQGALVKHFNSKYPYQGNGTIMQLRSW
ncbi:FAD-dependent oxidoreductase [Cohnella faecalis]|uniref:FAD-dependent oxidoreductase n=1 Tax=Cohnella faecalis TaxID=2315694 RepID=A0A398CE99_9BACL|nr:FAD-dependent oxidoreductase [Cohnella faecalis]